MCVNVSNAARRTHDRTGGQVYFPASQDTAGHGSGGVLPARRTASGRRYWLQPDLDRYWGRTAGGRARRTVGYCRVSSQAERPDLKNQRRIVEELAIAKGNAKLAYIHGIGGALNFKR